MREMVDISYASLALGYLLLIAPFALVLIYKVPVAQGFMVSVVRMTVQLLFVGLYLQVVFELDRWWLTGLWLIAMVTAADLSILRESGLRTRRFWPLIFLAIFIGTLIPLSYFLWIVLRVPGFMEPQYVIPIGGMIMGNCLRAVIIGLGRFYRSIGEGRSHYEYTLAEGASLREASLPHMSRAMQEALSPTIATMMTIGLVSLPGMMTGILMAGASPAAAIKYQIAIMISILTGTVLTVVLGLELTMKRAFTTYGVLRGDTRRE